MPGVRRSPLSSPPRSLWPQLREAGVRGGGSTKAFAPQCAWTPCAPRACTQRKLPTVAARVTGPPSTGQLAQGQGERGGLWQLCCWDRPGAGFSFLSQAFQGDGHSPSVNPARHSHTHTHTHTHTDGKFPGKRQQGGPALSLPPEKTPCVLGAELGLGPARPCRPPSLLRRVRPSQGMGEDVKGQQSDPTPPPRAPCTLRLSPGVPSSLVDSVTRLPPRRGRGFPRDSGTRGLRGYH